MRQRFILVFLLIVVCLQSARAQSTLDELPNDPRLDGQWAVNVIGLECAWGHTTGSSDVTVAVIDSGIDPDHPDLQGVIRDDGYNTIDESNDPLDENGHGTHVAGIIAATINNNEGIAGVAGGGTRILPIKVMSGDGTGTTEDIAEGVRYAISKDVQIINMSLGSLLPLGSEEIVRAIQEAHDAGILVIIAAGNSYVPIPNFAFGVEQFAMIIAATDPDDHKTDFSQYGPWIALSSPGDGILSTMPTYDVYLTTELPPDQRFRKNYDTMSGTSQATPIVAGVAALLFAAHPDWSASKVRAEIQNNAFDIADKNPAKQLLGITYFDPKNLGSGRVDACEALGGPVASSNASVPGASGKGDASLLPWILIGSAVVLLLVGGFFLLRRRGGGRVPPQPAPMQSPNYQQPQYTPTPPDQYAPPRPQISVGGAGPATEFYVPPPGGTPMPPAAPSSPPQGNQATEFYVPPAARGDATEIYAPAAPPAAPGGDATAIYPGAPKGGDVTQMPPPRPMPAWGKLTVVDGPEPGRFFLLRGEEVVLGRDPAVTFPLPDPSVSRRHVRIWRSGNQVMIEDLGSSYGTLVNGSRIQGKQTLNSNDQFHIGQTTLRFDS